MSDQPPVADERTEYGAKVIQTGTIYMHDFSNQVVEKFITEMSTAAPIRLVTRLWVGATPGAWKEVGT